MRATATRWLLLVATVAACESQKQAAPEPGQGQGQTKVELCDGQHSVSVAPDSARTPAQGQAISDALMAQWRLANPGSDWDRAEREAHAIQPPADNQAVLRGEQRVGQTQGQFDERHVLEWQRDVELAVLGGSRVFHSADELGSTIAVSCDMCHPHAANTHPETYPKFQTQIGRTVLLRDMINWCLEHPVRAPPMAADDPRMRAMEAYILAQRKGATMDYGRH
jgi:thiosulfate dehydrogenase